MTHPRCPDRTESRSSEKAAQSEEKVLRTLKKDTDRVKAPWPTPLHTVAATQHTITQPPCPTESRSESQEEQQTGGSCTGREEEASQHGSNLEAGPAVQ